MDKAASTLSRRNLVLGLAGGTVLAGFVALLPVGTAPLSRQARRFAASNRWARRFISLAEADMGEWAGQIGSVFQVTGGWSLRLAGVRALPSSGARPAGLGRDRAFVAVFDVLRGADMPGDLIYTAAHRDYGAFDLFLTAAEASGATRRMHAVFN